MNHSAVHRFARDNSAALQIALDYASASGAPSGRHGYSGLDDRVVEKPTEESFTATYNR